MFLLFSLPLFLSLSIHINVRSRFHIDISGCGSSRFICLIDDTQNTNISTYYTFFYLFLCSGKIRRVNNCTRRPCSHFTHGGNRMTVPIQAAQTSKTNSSHHSSWPRVNITHILRFIGPHLSPDMCSVVYTSLYYTSPCMICLRCSLQSSILDEPESVFIIGRTVFVIDLQYRHYIVLYRLRTSSKKAWQIKKYIYTRVSMCVGGRSSAMETDAVGSSQSDSSEHNSHNSNEQSNSQQQQQQLKHGQGRWSKRLKINYSCFRKIRSHYFVIIVLKLEIQCAVNQFE